MYTRCEVAAVGFLNKTQRLIAIPALALMYMTVLWFGLTEESRRSMVVSKSTATDTNFVIVEVRVTSVDTAARLLHERIKLIPSGRFAIDEASPAVDLELLINSASGKQTVRFPKGQRIFPIEFDNLLSGNQNRYPFDKYLADIDLLITAPEHAKTKSVQTGELNSDTGAPTTDLVVGANYFRSNEVVALREDFTASLPGLKFNGVITQTDANKIMHTSVALRRANSVISVSVLVMVVMGGLAISVMAMVMRVAVAPSEINLVPLSLCLTLIFGLPALRSVQPGVPGVGVLSDYISFIWAEFIVSTSAIALMWAWISRSGKSQRKLVDIASTRDD
jgi:Domain of unknown function (DUF4436)